MVPIKQFGAVVDMAERLRDLHCRFVIAGDGPERRRCRRAWTRWDWAGVCSSSARFRI